MAFFTSANGGAVVVGRLGGGAPMVVDCAKAVGDGTALFRGDFVTSTTTGGPTNGLTTVTQAAAGAILFGVVVDIKPDYARVFMDPALDSPASTAQIVRVCNDPMAVFEIASKSTGAGSAHFLGSDDIGKTADFEVGSGSATTGASATFLDATELSTTRGASGKPLRIIDIVDDGIQSFAVSASQTVAIGKVRVVINLHELIAGGL
jgi:hypothetical protein